MIHYVVKREDFKRLLEAPDDLRIRLVFRLLHDLALRTTELCTLTLEGIDLENRTIIIIDSKKRKPFTLPLTTKCCELIKEFITLHNVKNGWLFPSPYEAFSGRHVSDNWVWQCVRRYACILNFPNWEKWCPRMFRRRFARNWIIKKGSLTGLQDILRHDMISSTAEYIDGIRFADESRKEFDQIMG